MIKFSWMELANPHFQQAVQAIWDCPMLDAGTSYSAHRIQIGLDKVEKEIKALRIELCQKFGKKDANGKLVNDERGAIQFENPSDEEEFRKEFTKEFEERSIELKVSKIDFEKLTSVRGISPRMWEFLKPICDNLPPEEEETPPDGGPANSQVLKIPFRKNKKS